MPGEEEKKGKISLILFLSLLKPIEEGGGDDDDDAPEEQVEFLGKAPKRKETRVTFFRK